MNIIKIIVRILLFYLILFISSLLYGSDNTIVVSFLDIDSSMKLSKNRLEIIGSTFNKINPDIIIFAGIKNIEELSLIQKSIKDYRYSKLVYGYDKKSHLGYLSKQEPAKFISITDQTYTITKKITLPIQKGFIHAIIKKGKYKLHILGVDLKNQEKDPIYNQTDMRRYEARKIRQIATQIIKEEDNPNILLMGNLNDSYGKSAVKAIYNRRFGISKRLFDLRPLDKINVSWTFSDIARDEYQRYDFAIVSSPLIPEILFDKSTIYSDNNWALLSTHRPITVTIECKDKALLTKDELKILFPNAVYKY